MGTRAPPRVLDGVEAERDDIADVEELREDLIE